MAWGIDKWDAKKVEAALKARGLSPEADNHGDYQSFVVKDPDNFTVAITNGKLHLGPWEHIFYFEFDGKRRKRVLVKIIGE